MFCVYEGDHLTLLNVYNAFIRVRGSMGLYSLCSKAPLPLLRGGTWGQGEGPGDEASVSIAFVPRSLPLLEWGGGDKARVCTVFVPRPLVHVT